MNCHILYGLMKKPFPLSTFIKSSHISMFSGFFETLPHFWGSLGHLDSLFGSTTIWHLGAGNVANRCLTRPSAHVDFWPWDDGWDSWWSFDWRWTGAASQLSKLPNYSLLGGQGRKWMDFSEKMNPTKRNRLSIKRTETSKVNFFGEGSVFRGQIEVPDAIWNYKCMW